MRYYASVVRRCEQKSGILEQSKMGRKGDKGLFVRFLIFNSTLAPKNIITDKMSFYI